MFNYGERSGFYATKEFEQRDNDLELSKKMYSENVGFSAKRVSEKKYSTWDDQDH